MSGRARYTYQLVSLPSPLTAALPNYAGSGDAEKLLRGVVLVTNSAVSLDFEHAVVAG
jgi:hypothetical protein